MFLKRTSCVMTTVVSLALGVWPASAQTMATFAGNGTVGYAGDGNFATNAALNHPKGIAVDAANNVYIADPDNSRVRIVSASGLISTYAGNGVAGFSGDGGQAVNASLNQVSAVALDSDGNLYIADSQNRRIRKVTPGGIITTIAGIGSEGFSGDGGAATSAQLGRPVAIAVDAGKNIFYADSTAERIRRISATGVITTVAGNGLYGVPAFSGDGSLATLASLGTPLGLALSPAGDIYVADADNNRVRKITASGFISTIAGNGSAGFQGDGGFAISSLLNIPSDVSVDGSGNLYIADAGNNRIRRVDATGVISTIAGIAVNGFSGDGGSPTLAMLNYPWSVLATSSGTLYLGDRANSRVREILPVVTGVNSPAFTPAGIVNGASFIKLSNVAPGGLAAIFGTDFASTTTIATTLPLPTSLSQTSVTFNGIPAPLFFVSPTQINAQVPFTIPPGLANVQILHGGRVSTIQTVVVPVVSPGLFILDVTGTGAIFHATSFTTVTAASPARIGEALTIYATGLGAVTPTPASGAPASFSPTNGTPTVTIGGVTCPLLFSGLAPTLVSIYQLNVVVPNGLATGNQTLQISMGGSLSNSATIAVSQ